MRSVLIVLVIVTCAPRLGSSQDVPFRDSGSDRIRLESGQLLEGIVIATRRDHAWVAVEKSWLEQVYPKLARSWDTSAIEMERERRRELTMQLTSWMEERPKWDELQAFLQSERERLAKKPLEKSPFFLKRLEQQEVDSIRRQDLSRKLVYLAAWIHGFRDVCQQPVSRLRAQLRDRKIDPAATHLEEWVALLPPKPDSEVEWRIRQALVEHQYGERLSFQGTRDFWLPVDNRGQPVGGNVADLLSSVLGPSRGRARPLDQAIRQAREKSLKAFSVLELATNAGGIPQSVSHRLYAAVAEDRWEPVLRVAVPVKPANAEAAQQVAEDPQVKEVLSLVKSLGLPIEPGRLNLALGAGAGVQRAIREAGQQLTPQVQLYAQSVDIPLWWPK